MALMAMTHVQCNTVHLILLSMHRMDIEAEATVVSQGLIRILTVLDEVVTILLLEGTEGGAWMLSHTACVAQATTVAIIAEVDGGAADTIVGLVRIR